MNQIRYSETPPGHRRRHYVRREDVEVLLSRLPSELWSRLRGVHFNDRGNGVRRLGYVNRGRREIALCALQPAVSLTRYLCRRSPRLFGALRGRQWPELAVRRFMLYDVFLHELGHLQIVNPDASDPRRRFCGETQAQQFADLWRKRLWSESFSHTDPVHHRPTAAELDPPEWQLPHVSDRQPATMLLA